MAQPGLAKIWKVLVRNLILVVLFWLGDPQWFWPRLASPHLDQLGGPSSHYLTFIDKPRASLAANSSFLFAKPSLLFAMAMSGDDRPRMAVPVHSVQPDPWAPEFSHHCSKAPNQVPTRSGGRAGPARPCTAQPLTDMAHRGLAQNISQNSSQRPQTEAWVVVHCAFAGWRRHDMDTLTCNDLTRHGLLDMGPT